MMYREHLQSRPPSLFSIKVKVLTGIWIVTALFISVFTWPWKIALFGPYELVLTGVMVLSVLVSLIFYKWKPQRRKLIHKIICILFGMPVLTAAIILLLIFCNVIPIC